MPKILVADDNTNIQKMVVLAFEERGIAVTSVGNGEAAVRRIPDVNPDLVLADVFMPVRNGYEVCEFVKKDERFSHVPVILLVGAFDPLDEKEARRVGADGVLKKPFVPPDPLIAMVMSALEKNPKVAAELAKAREVVVAPPEPILPAMEIPAKAEPKPLPEYPEPTPEEAAAIYGFGKGVRTMDDADEQSAKGPAVANEEEDETEEEFDGSSTTSDWRRSTANFEVPEEVGGKLAFANDEDFNPVTFPSERDVPPRHIRVEEPEEEIKPVVVEQTPEPVHAETIGHSPIAEVATREPEVPAVAEAPEPPAAQPAAAQPEEKQPSLVSKAMHWMDMMAPTPAENSNGGGWMSNLLGGFRKEHEKNQETAQEPAPVQKAAAPAEPEPAPVIEARNDAREEAKQESHAEVLAEVPAESAPAEPIEPVVTQSESHWSGIESQLQNPSPQSSWQGRHWTQAPPPLEESAAEAVSEPVASVDTAHSGEHASDSNEFERDDEGPEPTLRDPMLVESPAVHVEPEPLLINEDAPARAEYGSPRESLTPLHSFFSPAGESVEAQPAASEPAAPTAIPSFEPAPVEAASDEFEGRIPTIPPPNREAISSIPFLNPPAIKPEEIRSEPSAPSASHSDSGNVDEVVKKVLEKLEPQLHQLLSQSVLKPLVENMLQKDLEKKDK